MGLALYRKYRPSTFAEVIGQDHVTGPLTIAVDSGRINHAYLFSGPRGCGKTSSARILARSLNCEQGPTSTPCGECQSCRDLAPDGPGNIDVIEIDAASHGGVDDARELRERAFQLPVASRYKVYIIDEAHMVTNQGFNALLKVVEEPPESVIFIFATTEPDKVLSTIRSRTHHYPFRLVPPAAMRTLLQKNCVDEGVEVESAVLPLVVRAGGGSVRDSQSLLDQLIAGSGSRAVSYADALALLGVTDAALLDDMVEAIGVGDGATVFGTVDRLVDAGHDPRRFASDLLERLRDLILLAAVPDAGAKGLLDLPDDQLERLADQASRLRLGTLSRLADLVHVGLTEMRGTTAPRLGLELICARMLLPQASGDAGALTQRVDRLERRMEIGGPPATDAPTTHKRQQNAPTSSDAGAGAGTGGSARARAEAQLVRARKPPAAGGPSTSDSAQSVVDSVTPAPAAAPSPATPPQRTAAIPAATARAATEPVAPAPVAEAVPASTSTRQASRPPSKSAVGSAKAEPAEQSAWPDIIAPGSGRSRPAPAEPKSEDELGPEAGSGTSATSHFEPDAVTQPTRRGDESSATSNHHDPVTEDVAERAAPQSATATDVSSAPKDVGLAAPVTGTAPGWDAAGVRRIWPDIVDSVKRSSKPLAAMVAAGSPAGVVDGVLTVAMVPGLVRRLSDPAQQASLQAALLEVLGVDWAIKIVPLAAELELEEADPRDEDLDTTQDRSDAPAVPVDPEEAAINLLRSELGASPLEN